MLWGLKLWLLNSYDVKDLKPRRIDMKLEFVEDEKTRKVIELIGKGSGDKK
jgi:hypothetical protein